MDCLFCAIVAGDIPARMIYEDDVAARVPRHRALAGGPHPGGAPRHTVDVLADDDVLAEIAPAVARVGRLLKERLGADACNILSNAGAGVGPGGLPHPRPRAAALRRQSWHRGPPGPR